MLDFISNYWWMFALLILLGGSGGRIRNRHKDD